MKNLLKEYAVAQRVVAEAHQAVSSSCGRDYSLIPSDTGGLILRHNDGNIRLGEKEAQWLYEQLGRILGHRDAFTTLQQATRDMLEAQDAFLSANAADNAGTKVIETRHAIEDLLR